MVSDAPGATRPAGEVVLRTRDLTKRYGQRLAVDGLNLEARRGEVFGFLGPNGAGKTTTIRMCLGLITPTSGAVEVLGRDVAQADRQVLPHVGALIEQPALYPYLSGRDNLRAIGDGQGGVSAARIDATLELVGLRERGGDRVKSYSLGMKQRLGLALALVQDPALLVLDEPTNGLDPAGMVEMRDLLRRLAAQGKSVFVSSHALGEVRQMCTRVAIINQGRLITEASVEELIRGQGEFVVALDRAAEALALVRTQPWGARARLSEQGQLITGAPEDESGTLNLFLVREGFTPRAIVPAEESLEDVFLRLTGAGAASGAATEALSQVDAKRGVTR
ncbi:MAG TPA: ABC transporter ATP-binding protein [Ktedonobacterales bacterium]|nr:ABC transporter ATP-binding protein [Ktedonobacterales bacterium]